MAKGRLNGTMLRRMRNAAIEKAKDQFREAESRLNQRATTAVELAVYRRNHG